MRAPVTWTPRGAQLWAALGCKVAALLKGPSPTPARMAELAQLANRLRTIPFPTADRDRWRPLMALRQQCLLVAAFRPGDPVQSLEGLLAAVADVLDVGPAPSPPPAPAEAPEPWWTN